MLDLIIFLSMWFLQTGRIFEHIQQELEQTQDDEEEAQRAIQEGIAKAESRRKSSD